jgi:hypothetical protein
MAGYDLSPYALDLAWRIARSPRCRESLADVYALDIETLVRANVMLDISERMHPDEVPR